MIETTPASSRPVTLGWWAKHFSIRRTLTLLYAIGGVAAVIASARAFRLVGFSELDFNIFATTPYPISAPEDNLLGALKWLAAGSILLGCALWAVPWRPASISDRRGFEGVTSRRALPASLIGTGLLLVLAEADGQWLGLELLKGLSPHIQFALLVSGIALLVWGTSGAALPPRRISVPWREIGLLGLLTGIGFALRVWNLNGTIRLFVDELNFADMMAYYRVEQVNLLFPINGIVAFPRIYTYFQWGTTSAFGSTLAGLRLPSAVFGTLTIPAVYLLGRSLFDRTTGYIAALLLVAYPPHLHFSRLGLNNIADPLFGTLAYAFLVRGLQTHRRANFALAGACLGLTQYFYEGGRGVFPVTMAVWVAALAVLWGQRLPWQGLILAALVTIIVAFPVYYTLAGLELPLTPRFDMIHDPSIPPSRVSSADTADAYVSRVKSVALGFLSQYEYASAYYDGRTPLLLIVVAPAFLIGVVVCLVHPRAPSILLLLWPLVATLGNGFLVGGFMTTRLVCVFPALALLCAIGFRAILSFPWPGMSHPRLQRAAMVGVVALITFFQGAYYFGPHLESFNYHLRILSSMPDETDAVMRAATFPEGTQIHLIGGAGYDARYARDTFRYLTGSGDRVLNTIGTADLTWGYLTALPRDVDQAFFLSADAVERLPLIRRFFTLSDPQYTDNLDIPMSEQYVLYYAKAEVAPE
ncbi:MAG TPA: glycosyltransferase family 39 protein [Aggregatilinea sp.]|uniref:ArnT family glycosyltransferase n=1 Tax=Aggregatilinea sp. TaxID=2806333 RepID=UPI002D0C4575|nr:glycosyltransferase family 39 protein [Aggregatilinea sp.]HML22841.1 glycosyltransferase family 39 protein [Aggregatilinea sp.]